MSSALQTSSRTFSEYVVYDYFFKEIIQNTSTKTLSRPTLCRREQTQYCTNFNSSHARRTLTTYMDSARATLEWRASPCVLEAAPTLFRVESLNKNADRRVHVCEYKNMSNGSICFNICTFKENSDIDSQRSKLQVFMCSCDRSWQESLMKSCIDSLHMILLSSAPMIVKGFCVRTWTRSVPEICLRMTTSRKVSEDVRSVTIMQTLDAHAKFSLIPMNSLRTMSWHSRYQHLSFKLFTFLEI